MSYSAHLRRLFAAPLVTCVLLATLVAPAAAGTTGGITGTVIDAQTQKPVADAAVRASSPSQTVSTTTDSAGRYAFVSLMPDTYTLTVDRTGYEPVSIAGISVFADQVQTLPVTMRASLRTIASVTSRSSLSPVKAGVTTDVYSVNPQLTQAAAPLGGGGGLNNAYSAIASMPGAFVPPGQMGVNQTVYIRGGYYDQIGYEYDGVPVNRSFDNYPAHSASTLGQQELEIYTGGGSANANATGLAGFINQVVKSGTYPGYGTLLGTVGTPAFYHDLSVEAGGASPDRMFSYYAGLSGYNQQFRYWDNANGADLTGEFPNAGELTTGPNDITSFTSAFYPAVYPNCDPTNPNLYDNPAVDNYSLWTDPGCFSSINPAYGNISAVNGREAVANLHFGIPHKHDGGRDDIQLLFTNSAQFRQYYTGPDDAGLPYINAVSTCCNGGLIYPPHWPDFYTFPSGTPFLAAATTSPIAYAFPGSPTNRCFNTNILGGPTVPNQCSGSGLSPLPNDYRDARWDQASIAKLQYQKNFGSNAYLRLFGYTFYSNTNRSGASGRGIKSGLAGTNYDYEVDAHTRGAQMQFADQISGTNQFSAMLDYVTSTTWRYNNGNYNNKAGQQISNLTNGSTTNPICYAAYSGYANGVTAAPSNYPFYNAGDQAPCNDPITQGTFGGPTSTSDAGNPEGLNPCATGDIPAGSAACTSGTPPTWALTYTGNQGPINNVTPKFWHAALIDEWRPTDKLDVNASLRLERDEFDLTSTSTPGKNYWYTAAQREFCYDPATFQPLLIPQAPQNASTLQPAVYLTCPGNTVHPDGLNGHILMTDVTPSSYTQTYSEPRLGFTYSMTPDTILRFSAGRYAQEPQNYEIQYNSAEENLASELVGFLPFGFFTPLHEAKAQFSNNYDFSLEHHIKGTDMSFKLTPYYRWATDQLYETVNVPTLNASPSLNSGTERTSGVELEFTKGDFNRNGLAFVLSYTYTNSKEKWANYANVPINPVDPYNEDIQNFNALTKAGGGAPCYTPTFDTSGNYSGSVANAVCASGDVRNPYYGMAAQPLLDKFAWYDTGLDFPYVSPNTVALVLNYKHDKWSITPAMSLNEGATYGTPADFIGYDPRTCAQNQSTAGIPTGDPLKADYTSCGFAETSTGSGVGNLYIPDPYTGSFDSFGQFRQPWQFNLGLQVRYDISPRVSANVTIANLVNKCFGGSSEPWTKQFPPNQYVCGYYANPFFISNFYNGTGPDDVVANGVPLNPFFKSAFAPAYGDTNSYNYPLPLQFFVQLQFEL